MMRRTSAAFARAIQHDAGIIERFWSHVVFGTSEDDCWEWQLRIKPGGYPMFFIGHHSIGATRVAWFTATGELPTGGRMRHSCDNSACVRPTHLAWIIGHRTAHVLEAMADGYVLAPKRGEHAK